MTLKLTVLEILALMWIIVLVISIAADVFYAWANYFYRINPFSLIIRICIVIFLTCCLCGWITVIII